MIRIKNGTAFSLSIGYKRETVNNSYHEVSLLGLSFQNNEEIYAFETLNSSIVEPINGRKISGFNLFIRF